MALTTESSDIDLCFGTTLFNDIINSQHQIDNTKMLGKVEISEDQSIYNDYYLKIVSQLFIQTKWQELFGLNVQETMNLEYSQYIYLKKLIEEYERKYKLLSSQTNNDLERKQKELTDKISRRENK